MKETLKGVARAVATLFVLPALASYAVRARVMGRDRALVGSSQALSLVPGLAGQYLRRAFLARVLAECHPTSCIEFGVLFSQAGTRIRKNAYIGPRCHIGLADIGADVMLASGVHVPSGGHVHGSEDLDVPMREQAGQPRVVTIGEGSWIGSAAVVMADVGCRSIVGAGSVVTKSVPDCVIAAGVPARVARERFAAVREAEEIG